MPDGDSVIDVSEYTTAIRRWWLVIAGCTAAGLVLGFLLLAFRTSELKFDHWSSAVMTPTSMQADR